MTPRTDFPIAPLLDPIRRSLDAHPRLVLEAPPGAGKTTQVPPALLDAAWLEGRRIVMLEPRRIAARAAAEFMAAQRGEDVGATVGYRIRLESRVSAATRIEVVTEGILTRMIQDDPELSGIGAILFDEFHERHLSGDLGAALALDIQANLRPDLRLVVMSATLAGARIERWLDAPRIASEGRGFPVRIVHPALRGNDDPTALRRAVTQALAENEGDVLVFLPGKREIEQARTMLSGAQERVDFVALHGELSVADQHAALAPAKPGTRRVILATNVAESSLTLPGIRAVVDTGLAREPRFDPASGFTRLETVSISQASADQRAGRAGRLGPGACYRLWPESRRLDPDRTPEIAQVELSGLALELAAWGSADLRWLDAPPPGAFAQGRDLLDALGALDRDGRITALGQRMRAASMHPRLAAMVVRADAAHAAFACDLAALVEARNPLRGLPSDDFRARARALGAWRTRDRAAARDVGADIGALASIAQVADAARRRLGIRSANATA
ncbi:MAG TPA: ATP-dependent helicase HrpB, partial [Rhodanobacteraceae bacterium]|nr:ATP-dependent helicase HrpB [Rhodanobacteraceae bacterium]